MRQQDILWLAGLLEGEGCFNYRADRKQARVTVEMTDRDIIERVARLFDTNISTRPAKIVGTCRVCSGPAKKCGFARAVNESLKMGKTLSRATERDRIYSGLGFQKESYQTALHGDRAKNLMRIVYPFMGERRRAKIEEILGRVV